MFCIHCGAQQKDDAKFCTVCGARLVGLAGEKPGGSVSDQTVRMPMEELVEQPVSPAEQPVYQPQPVSPVVQPVYQPQPARPATQAPAKSGRAIVAVAAILVVLALGSVVAAGALTNWFGLAAPKQEEPPASAQTPSEEPQPEEEPSQEMTPAEEEPAEPEEPENEGPEVRDAVADYSWDELSEISTLISEASSESEAHALAREYNLCNEDGTLDGTQTKPLTLEDGTTVTVQIAGFAHDRLADGSGYAGITFVSRGLAGTHAYNADDSTAGGWRDSDLRAWMNDDLLDQLPSELADVVLTVSKPTNATGETDDASSVVDTSDTLWTLSYSEIGGYMNTEDSAHDAVYNAEGAQYQLFSDLGVRWDSPNESLRFSGADYWWERSPDPMDGTYVMCVGEDGTPWYARMPSGEYGVVLRFCV